MRHAPGEVRLGQRPGGQRQLAEDAPPAPDSPGGLLEEPLSAGLLEDPPSAGFDAPASAAFGAGFEDPDDTDAELDERESVL